MIARRIFLAALTCGLLAAPLAASAQQARKLYRIGLLRVGTPPPTFIEPFRQGLRERGYIEGRNVIIEYGVANSVAQLPDIAAGLLRLKVDVLMASGTPSVVPAKNVSNSVPVVFVAAIDPVATGLVASLARPGGNFTGVSAVHADAIGKRVQLLKELLPNASRIAFLVRATSPATAQYTKEAELAAANLGMQLQVVAVKDRGELEGAFALAKGASALLQVDDAMLTSNRITIAELALRNLLPTISGLSESVEAGGLLSYGPHYGDLYKRAAAQVDQILRGAKAGALPVEQPTTFELVINLKTARALGLTIPPAILVRADRIIE